MADERQGATSTRRHPGEKPVAPAGPPAQPVRIRLCQYNHQEHRSWDAPSAQDLEQLPAEDRVTWITVEGLTDPGLIAALGGQFGLHPLVQEDILDPRHRPKLEEYEGYLFVVLKRLSFQAETRRLKSEHVSMVLLPHVLLVFQESRDDLFSAVRERIEKDRGRIRRMGADYLLHALLDTIVDGYFFVFEDVGFLADGLETSLERNPSPELMHQIHRLRRQALLLRKSVWPLREVFSKLAKKDFPLIQEETEVYMRDLYDHSIQTIDAAETLRDILSGLLDLYLSSVSNRMNAVMKVLTIIATIFIPLTFLAGVYGMNFHYMPELRWRWAYPAVLGVMAVAAAGMLLFFRKRKWI